MASLDDDKWKWWYFLIAGIGTIGFAVWEYRDLARLEEEGGEHLMDSKLYVIYEHFGKGGVLAVGLTLGGLLTIYSFWERNNIRRDRDRERQKQLELEKQTHTSE